MTIDSKDLVGDPNSGVKDLFRWFLASFLFGKRIRQETAGEPGTARRAWEALVEHGLNRPEAILDTGWHELKSEPQSKLQRARALRIPGSANLSKKGLIDKLAPYCAPE